MQDVGEMNIYFYIVVLVLLHKYLSTSSTRNDTNGWMQYFHYTYNTCRELYPLVKKKKNTADAAGCSTTAATVLVRYHSLVCRLASKLAIC